MLLLVFGIGVVVGIVIGFGICIGICVGVGIGIGVGTGSISQHLTVYGIIWWQPRISASGLAASGSIWDHLCRLG